MKEENIWSVILEIKRAAQMHASIIRRVSGVNTNKNRKRSDSAAVEH